MYHKHPPPIERIREAIDCDEGWCPDCRDFTRDGMTEPDAEGYPCPECGRDIVEGAEQALFTGAYEPEPSPLAKYMRSK